MEDHYGLCGWALNAHTEGERAVGSHRQRLELTCPQAKEYGRPPGAGRGRELVLHGGAADTVALPTP